jgi:ribosomal protein S5
MSLHRDALRNLTHVDLYDNFGLAHDLYGKHNACHCYIRATPIGREMVGGEYATCILQLFGISSASVKFEGRRHPYAMVRSLFNAIGKHVNIDDQAKARGQRYLTMRWAKDNNIV